MKILKLNYHNGEIYEKYKINSILNLLVDRHKLQNESFDFNDLGNQKTNYSIIAYLGSQIKNINEDNYKNIDTNDIILALSELKKLDERIIINEGRNKNYVLEIAKQLYFEYVQQGLLQNDSFNFHSKNFMDENIELMNEINREIQTYEEKIYHLRTFAEDDRRKRESYVNPNMNVNIMGNVSSANSVVNFNEHELFDAVNENHIPDDPSIKLIQEPLLYNKPTHEFSDKTTHNIDTISELNVNVMKQRNYGQDHNNTSVDHTMHIKRNSRNSHVPNNSGYEQYEPTYKNPLGSKTNLDFMKDDLSTHCNSNERIHENLNYVNENHLNRVNKINSLKNLPTFQNIDTQVDDEIGTAEMNRRNTFFEKKDDTISEYNHRRSTIKDNIGGVATNNFMNELNEHKNSVFEQENEKIHLPNNSTPYKHISEPVINNNIINNDHIENPNFMKRDSIFNRKNDGFKADVDVMSNRNSNISAISKNNSTSLFSRNRSNCVSNVLDHIDKVEQQLVHNHLKNSLTHNENVARRMSSILLNPNGLPKNNTPRKSYEVENPRKFTSNSLKNYNEMSLNRYGSIAEQMNHFNMERNNDSSGIISTIKKPCSTDINSYKGGNEYEGKNLSNHRMRMQSFKENNIHNIHENFNQPIESNTNTPLHQLDNMSNYSRKYAKSSESNNLNMYTQKYSRALDINDLNSNTSRNYVTTSNSIKSDFNSRDNYAKMLNGSRSFSSQLPKVPLSFKYLKANI